jgi:hypothetical protein
MKRSTPLFLAILLFGGLASLFPCDITMETSQASGKDRVNVKLIVEYIHKRCPVSIEKTTIATDGMTIEKQGPWKKDEEGNQQMDLVVFMNGKVKGEIRVRRECPKTGHQEETLKLDPRQVSGTKE